MILYECLINYSNILFSNAFSAVKAKLLSRREDPDCPIGEGMIYTIEILEDFKPQMVQCNIMQCIE